MASSKRTIDHDEIKQWAEARGARPARVKGTGKNDDPGLLRLNFPEYAEDKLEDISWNEFFQKFDENGLSLLYQDMKSNGQMSNFSRFVRRNPSEKSSVTSPRARAPKRNSVAAVMNEDVVWVSPKDGLEEAALIMTDCDCGELPVVDEDLSVVGVITDRDIVCRSLGVGRDPFKLTVKDCMTSPAVTISMDATMDECLDLMEKNLIRRIVVVDDENRCCGMISEADLIQEVGRKATDVLQEISKPADEPSRVQLQ